MARSLRLAKAERDWLKSILAPTSMDWSALGGTKSVKLAASILTKVEESEERAPGVNASVLEEALIRASRGRVVALESASAYARASRQAGLVGATVDDSTMVGEWMGRQPWLTGPMTIIDVLNKWASWVPKARATQPPARLEPGLGNDTTGVPKEVLPKTQSQSSGKGGRLPGFR